jgi:hypothetical protein
MTRFRSVKTPILLAAALGLALAGCISKEGDRPAGASTPQLFKGVPIPREAHVVDTASTPEAVRAVLRVNVPSELVLAFYRRELPNAGFRIIGDLGDSAQADLYAQRDGPPLWVQVRRGQQPGTTVFTLIGALGGAADRRDSAAADTVRRPAPR